MYYDVISFHTHKVGQKSEASVLGFTVAKYLLMIHCLTNNDEKFHQLPDGINRPTCSYKYSQKQNVGINPRLMVF